MLLCQKLYIPQDPRHQLVTLSMCACCPPRSPVRAMDLRGSFAGQKQPCFSSEKLQPGSDQNRSEIIGKRMI